MPGEAHPGAQCQDGVGRQLSVSVVSDREVEKQTACDKEKGTVIQEKQR